MVYKFWIYLYGCWDMIFVNIKLWLPVWTGIKVQIGSLFGKYLLTINDLYNGKKLEMYLLWLLRYDCFNSKLWLPVWTGSKGLIGVTFLSSIFFVEINDLYNSAQIVVVEIWKKPKTKIFNFDFRFGQEVKVKLGSPFRKYFFEN